MPAPRYSSNTPARPSQPFSGFGALPRTADSIRKFLHGAGSAMLIFGGANSMMLTPLSDLSYADLGSIEGMAQSMFGGELSGPAQLAAAILLFLAAGRCTERFIGFVVATILVLAHLNGFTPTDLWTFTSHFAQRLGAAAEAFHTAQVS